MFVTCNKRKIRATEMYHLIAIFEKKAAQQRISLETLQTAKPLDQYHLGNRYSLWDKKVVTDDSDMVSANKVISTLKYKR